MPAECAIPSSVSNNNTQCEEPTPFRAIGERVARGGKGQIAVGLRGGCVDRDTAGRAGKAPLKVMVHYCA